MTKGLVPYKVFKPEFKGLVYKDQLAIWGFERFPSGHGLIGQLCFTAMKHGSWSVMCLTYDIPEEEFLRTTGGGKLIVLHDGTLVSSTVGIGAGRIWPYHSAEPARFVTRIIRPEEITVKATWDLERQAEQVVTT